MLLCRKKTTSYAQASQLRTCKLCDSNGFIISACLFCFASFSKRLCLRLGVLFEKEKCSCFVALLQSVQKVKRKWRSFSHHMPEIHCFPEGQWTGGGWSVAFKKEKHCIWQQEEEEGREEVECQPGSGFRPGSNVLDWHEAPNSCLFSMLRLHKNSHWWGWSHSQKHQLTRHPIFAFHFPFRTLWFIV